MAETKSTTVCAVTTIDNPFNPIDDYDRWLSYDIAKGYNTSNYLANLAITSDFFSNEENDREVEFAIDEIVGTNPEFYKKIKKQIN